VGPDVRRAWLVCCSTLSFVFVCAHVDVKKLRVREAGCIVACFVGARVQASCIGTAHPLWCLMSHVVGAASGHDLYAPPRALPNVRERGALPTDGALHVPNSGRTPPSAIADLTVSNRWLTPSTSSGDFRTISPSCLCWRWVPLTGWIMMWVYSLIHISPIQNIKSNNQNLCNMVRPLGMSCTYTVVS